nr:chloride intracellular channel protein 5-like [Meriones unguiculatus]
MNEDYSDIYDTIQKERRDENPDPLEENDAPLYDEVHEDLWAENDLYATRLESHEYDSLSVYVSKREEATPAFPEPEAESYLLPDEVFSEPQEVRDISMGDSHPSSQDPEPLQKELQEKGRMMTKKELPSLLSFTVQHSRAFSTGLDSPTCLSDATGLEGNKVASSSPEIFLFVKNYIIPNDSHEYMQLFQCKRNKIRVSSSTPLALFQGEPERKVQMLSHPHLSLARIFDVEAEFRRLSDLWRGFQPLGTKKGFYICWELGTFRMLRQRSRPQFRTFTLRESVKQKLFGVFTSDLMTR